MLWRRRKHGRCVAFFRFHIHIITHFCSTGFCLWLSFWQFFHIVWVWSLHNRRAGMVAPQESRPPCNSTEQDASQSINKVWRKRKAVFLLCYIFISKPSKPLEEVQEVMSRRGERGSCRLNYQTIDCYQLVLQFPGPGHREEEGQGWLGGHP